MEHSRGQVFQRVKGSFFVIAMGSMCCHRGSELFVAVAIAGIVSSPPRAEQSYQG